MVKHIILWTLKDEYTEAQKAEIRAGIKEGLEGLKGQIPGMIDISVRTDYLPTSTVDVMLDTTFEDADALAAYAKNPKHVAVADTKVRPFTANRACMHPYFLCGISYKILLVFYLLMSYSYNNISPRFSPYTWK